MKNKNSKPTGSVSVIIPAYNSENFIRRAIDSVLAQTHPAEEIIVVDDGSTDNTREIVQSYGPPVQYVHQANAGPGAARNAGIQAAKVEWIAFLDSDDEWLPEKLQVQLDLLKRHPDLVWATANYSCCLCDENRRGPELDPVKAEQLMAGKEYFDSYFSAYLSGCGGCTDTMIVRRSVFETVGLFDTSYFRAEDSDLWCRIAFRQPRIAYYPQPLAIYHIGVADSLMRQKVHCDLYIKFLELNLRLAEEYHRYDEFKLYAGYSLQLWIRDMLFESNAEGIRQLLNRFGFLLPIWFRVLMRLMATYPRASACLCRAISRVVRLLRLRKRITRKPKT